MARPRVFETAPIALLFPTTAISIGTLGVNFQVTPARKIRRFLEPGNLLYLWVLHSLFAGTLGAEVSCG
jgi:hypothetical protein